MTDPTSRGPSELKFVQASESKVHAESWIQKAHRIAPKERWDMPNARVPDVEYSPPSHDHQLNAIDEAATPPFS